MKLARVATALWQDRTTPDSGLSCAGKPGAKAQAAAKSSRKKQTRKRKLDQTSLATASKSLQTHSRLAEPVQQARPAPASLAAPTAAVVPLVSPPFVHSGVACNPGPVLAALSLASANSQGTALPSPQLPLTAPQPAPGPSLSGSAAAAQPVATEPQPASAPPQSVAPEPAPAAVQHASGALQQAAITPGATTAVAQAASDSPHFTPRSASTHLQAAAVAPQMSPSAAASATAEQATAVPCPASLAPQPTPVIGQATSVEEAQVSSAPPAPTPSVPATAQLPHAAFQQIRNLLVEDHSLASSPLAADSVPSTAGGSDGLHTESALSLNESTQQPEADVVRSIGQVPAELQLQPAPGPQLEGLQAQLSSTPPEAQNGASAVSKFWQLPQDSTALSGPLQTLS